MASTPTPRPEGARSIDVGGYSLEIRCAGQGTPTVILENGALPFVDVFEELKRQVSDEWRVCSYDRAGTGKSGAGTERRTASTIADELHRLLIAAGEQGPFVFGSWSAGAPYTLAYAAAFPDEVAGIVFVDPRTPTYQLAMPSPFAGEDNQVLLQRLPARLPGGSRGVGRQRPRAHRCANAGRARPRVDGRLARSAARARSTDGRLRFLAQDTPGSGSAVPARPAHHRARRRTPYLGAQSRRHHRRYPHRHVLTLAMTPFTHHAHGGGAHGNPVVRRDR